MTDWAQPTINSQYDILVADFRDRDDDLARQFDGVTSSNIPTGAIRWSSANRRHEKWDGTSWAELVSTGYNISADRLGGQDSAFYRNAGNLNAGTLPAARFNDTAHGSRGGGSLHALATQSANGFMAAGDKAKLDGLDGYNFDDFLAGFDPTDKRHTQYTGSLNDVSVNSIYNVAGSSVTEAPADLSSWGFLHTLVHVNSANYRTQLLYAMNGASYRVWMRHYDAAVWGGWELVLDGPASDYAKLAAANVFSGDNTFSGNNSFSGENGVTGQFTNFSHTGASITFDVLDAPDGRGGRRITCNDGGGNWNFRTGNYYNAGEKYTKAGDGAVKMTMNTDGQAGAWYVTVAGAAAAAGDNVTYDGTLQVTTGAVTFNNEHLWRMGNVGPRISELGALSVLDPDTDEIVVRDATDGVGKRVLLKDLQTDGAALLGVADLTDQNNVAITFPNGTSSADYTSIIVCVADAKRSATGSVYINFGDGLGNTSSPKTPVLQDSASLVVTDRLWSSSQCSMVATPGVDRDAVALMTTAYTIRGLLGAHTVAARDGLPVAGMPAGSGPIKNAHVLTGDAETFTQGTMYVYGIKRSPIV